MNSTVATATAPAHRHLSRFLSPARRERELVTRPGAAGSVLVIDRDARTRGDLRLVAHLDADEPAANAAIVASRYAEDAARRPRLARPLRPDDELLAPPAEEAQAPVRAAPVPLASRCGGSSFALREVRGGLSIPELRWCRRELSGCELDRVEIVSLRDVVASLECYEPALAITRAALSRGAEREGSSRAVLRQEHARMCRSPIVLNRGLREALLGTLARGEASMSEIAMRCGRIKRDGRGNESGETSWLARRVGLLAEGGAERPTPWIHSDVLALIAREGLGLSPREVEL